MQTSNGRLRNIRVLLGLGSPNRLYMLTWLVKTAAVHRRQILLLKCSDLIADNLHDYLKQGNDPEEFMLAEEVSFSVNRQPPNNAELWIKIRRLSSCRSRTYLSLCRIDLTRFRSWWKEIHR